MVKQNFSGRFLVFLPIVLTFIIYFASTTSRAVTDYDEGFYAQAAQHMVESGNWVTPYANGVRFLEKPPLLYWVTAVSFKIFGINEFALRLPTAFAVIALVWIVVLIVRKLSDERAALAAGLSTAFSIGTYIFTRETLHDIWLVLFIAVAMYAFLNWYLDPRHSLKPALVFYAAIAGAVLCKSVIGAVFPMGIVVVFFLLSKKWPKWRTLHALPGFLLFSLLTVPWHLLAAIQNKGFLEYFFVGEQFMRFLGKHETVGSVPLAVFWALILVWFFPWTAFLPAAFARVRKNPDENQRILVKLASAWAMVILGFFSVSARLEHYVFPAIPALSLFVGVALHKNEESKSVSWAFRGLAILGILLAVIGAVTGIWFVTGRDFGSLWANPWDRAGSTDFTIMASMPMEIILELIHPAWITIASIALGFGIGFQLEVHRRRIHALMCVAVVMAVIFGMTNWSLRICEDLISSKKIALAIERETHAGDRMVVVGDYEAANSLNFYQPLQVEVVDGVAPTFPGDPGIVLTKSEYLAVWRSPERVFVLAPTNRIDALAPEGTEIMTVYHRMLVRNH
jgi:4-amino-4-deoxy-L-arabinose transferase-like glycosyltransferase